VEVESLDDILAHYKALSADYGFEVDVPQSVLAMHSTSLMHRGLTDEMLRILSYMLERNASSLDALWRVGNYFEGIGELDKAVHYYERMIQLMGSDAGMIKGRVEQLKSKIAEQPEE
jgi:hypothetical protein